MKIIRPLAITQQNLKEISITEDEAAPWDSASPYTKGAKVLHFRKVYEALADVAAGVEPGAEMVTATSPAKWFDLGYSNRWKMFDDRVESRTTSTFSLEFCIAPGQVVNAVAMLNLKGRSVTVSITDPLEGEVYRRTDPLLDAGVDNWYDWYFAPIPEITDVAMLDLPSYGTADVRVTVENPEGPVSVGHFVIGKLVNIGVTEYGSSVGISDFSRKGKDDFGNYQVVERSFSKRAEFDVLIDTDKVGSIQRELASLRAKPVVWVGNDDMEATIIFGFYQDFDITISGPEVSDAVITIEGLV